MIPCQKCGHSNPLGTLFCHACGEKLSVSANQVMGSIKQTSSDNQDLKILRLGKNAIGGGVFVFAIAVIFQAILVPDAPPPSIPLTADKPVAELFEARPPWLDASIAGEEAPAVWPQPVGIDADRTTLAWRQGASSQLLSSFGIDLGQVRAWQQAIVAVQEPVGAFPGRDRTAATALACLALQAYPGDPAIDAAADKARAHLRKQLGMLRQGRGSDLAVALTATALYEADGAKALTGLSQLLKNGKEPQWQTWCLTTLRPDHVPDYLEALKLQAGKDPVTALLFSLLEDGATIPADGMASRGAIAGLDPISRALWSRWQWLRLGDLKVYARTLQEWSKLGTPDPAPADFSLHTGRQTDQALAVLACTAPAAIPVTLHATQ